jgi:hypothetical protein
MRDGKPTVWLCPHQGGTIVTNMTATVTAHSKVA